MGWTVWERSVVAGIGIDRGPIGRALRALGALLGPRGPIGHHGGY